jgi:Uma2 family endonuclease
MTARHKVMFLAGDIWDTPEDGKIYEVIDGDLFVTPPPGWMHQFAVGKLQYLLAGHIYPHKLGVVVPAPTGVVLDEHDGVEPDLVYISRARMHIISERGVEGAPDLVVEVLSPSTKARDRGIKMRRYAAAGVPHYWMLDPGSQTLEAYRLRQGGYELVETCGPGGTFRPELFPGLEIAIDELWQT